jgi:hypothetical protein
MSQFLNELTETLGSLMSVSQRELCLKWQLHLYFTTHSVRIVGLDEGKRAHGRRTCRWGSDINLFKKILSVDIE